MNRNLFSLAWRETTRSAYWGKSLATSIGLGFLALYFSASFLVLGMAIPKIITSEFPDADPVSKFNSFVLGYFAFDLIIRQMMQKLPTVSFRPLLVLNIRRRSIANYLMIRSVINFLNILPFFVLVPVLIKLVLPAYSGIATLAWLAALILLVFSSHFLSIFLKWKFNEAEYQFFIFLAVIGGLFALNYFGLIHFASVLGQFLDLVLKQPLAFLPLAILPVFFYFLNLKFLQNRMFINLVSSKKKEEKIGDYSWLDRLGENGRFIALELKLIWRNKRPRSVAMMTLIMLAYGLLIYKSKPGEDIPDFALILGGVIIVGMFSISYGQFFPAWHSNYFPMLMCQRLTMKQFLRSFYLLVSVVSVICYILSLPYVFLVPQTAYTHLSMLLYNLGVNIPILFWIGLYSKKRLDLNQSSVMNYQGVGASQWLAGFPLLIGPILFYYLFKLAFGQLGGFIGLGALGLIGILLHPILIDFFSKKYLQQKHQLIKNYKNS